jgi:cytochrome bd-type quinol oxidase subunit 2
MSVYARMSVQANQVQTRYGILAAFFAWITLAGYVVLPATFTSIQNTNKLEGNAGGRHIQHAVQNIPVLPLASILCCMGLAGSFYLWWKWRANYTLILSRIFLYSHKSHSRHPSS